MSDTMSLSRRADALEAKMAQELDYIVVKSRLHMLAEADLGSPPNAGALMKANPNARVLMGDDPRLPAMPEKPTLVDFFRHRFGPSMHLLLTGRSCHCERAVTIQPPSPIASRQACRSPLPRRASPLSRGAQ